MPQKTIYWPVALIFAGFLLAATNLLAQAAPALDAANGEAIFNAKCASCHTVGKGKLVGPDLKGVTQRRDAAWLTTWLKAPDAMLASGDPIAAQLLADSNNVAMPNMALSDADVANLMAYFQSVDNPPAASIQAPASIAPTPQPPTTAQVVLMLNGDADYGQQIFTGSAALQNGGTNCISCHTVNGVGLIGGGNLGPDLTHVFTKYGGRTGLASTLGTLPFPTMQGIFTTRQLTDTEQADLLAFFERADEAGPAQTQQNFLVVLAGGSGMAVFLLAGMFYFWPRQRMGIAQRLRKNGKL